MDHKTVRYVKLNDVLRWLAANKVDTGYRAELLDSIKKLDYVKFPKDFMDSEVLRKVR